MFTSLQTRLKRASRWLPVALLPFAAHAQVASYTFSQTTGTYTAITGGTVLGSATSDDQQFNDVATPLGATTATAAAGLPIGFSFQLGGATYDRFAVNNNGWVALGSSTTGTAAVTALFASASSYSPISAYADVPANVIAPFADDLQAQAGSQLSYNTLGTAPNRILVVQWSNYRFYGNTGDNFNFQVRLNETINTVVFSYGAFTTALPTNAGYYAQVGLRGRSGFDFTNRTTTTTWAASTPGTSNTDVVAFSSTILPANGLTYTFTPGTAPASDAAVTSIYALGRVSSLYGSPATVSAIVYNAGSAAQTNLAVTLTVSGATTFTNTQTVATLAPGAATTVTFAAYPVTATTGTNTLTVTVPTDAVLTNNSRTFAQAASASTLSYLSGTTINGSVGLPTAGTVLAVGYRTANAAAVSTVTPYFVGANTTGATYQVLVYAAAANGQPGTVLYTSPARPRPTGAAGTVSTETVTIPNIVVNGAFFIGLRTVGADNLGVAYQTENPLRASTFFLSTNGTTWSDLNTQSFGPRLVVDVALSTPTATRNEALAATVGLYPNPAHGTFTLGVPAGSLRTASATLINALGQVVQTRRLNLPAAGGTADFDVSRLAPGVYSLSLKSGNDLVVKRVVVE